MTLPTILCLSFNTLDCVGMVINRFESLESLLFGLAFGSCKRVLSQSLHIFIKQQFIQSQIQLAALFCNNFIMDNPEAALPPHTMYAYDTHRNIPWNQTEYQPKKEYLDPVKQITERKFRDTPKGQKNTNYVTKRGFYMDYHVKVVKALPAPDSHPPADPWDQTMNLKKQKINKLDKSLSKYTYLDAIVSQQKLRSTPAPGSYSLNKTDKEIEAKLKELSSKKKYQGDKHFFYQDTQFVSNNLGPGSGNCNPHLDVPHLRINKTNHKFWIQKHKKESTKMQKRRSVEPAPGTHTPIPVDCTTFDRIKTAQQTKRKKKATSVSHGFGSDARFTYTRQNKKRIIEQRPAPCAHNLVLEWKGKNMDPKKDNWIRSRSYGPSHGVYN